MSGLEGLTRDGAREAARDINGMLSLAPPRGPRDWRPPIVLTVAARGQGLDELLDALDKHDRWLRETGELDRRRRVRAADEVEAIALTALRERLGTVRGGAELERLAGLVAAGKADPYAAADELVEAVTA